MRLNFTKKMRESGFWDDGKWKEYNDEGKSFEDVISDFLDEKLEFRFDCSYDISVEQAFESPGVDIYAIAISLAYCSNKEDVFSDSLLFITYSC